MRRVRRLALALLLGAAGCAKSEAEWIADLAAPEPFARVLAVTALAKAGRSETLPLLLAALDDPSEEVRAATGAALARWGDPAAPPLIEALRPEASQVDRHRALATLPLLGAHAAAPLVEALLDGEHVSRDILELLQRLDAEAAGPVIPTLVAALEAPLPEQRRLAAEALHFLAGNDREALLGLLRTAHDPDPVVRATAMKAIVGTLLKRMRTTDGLARHVAEVQIQTLGTEALPALARALREAAPEEAAEPIAALATHGAAALMPAFGVLNHRDPQHLQRACALAAAIGPDALEPLAELMDSDDPAQRLLATVALGALGPAARPAVPRLLQDLKDKDTLRRWAAAHALGLIGPSDDDQLLQLLGAARDADHVLRDQLAPALVEALLDRIGTRPAQAAAWRERLLALRPEATPQLERIAGGSGPRAALARSLLEN